MTILSLISFSLLALLSSRGTGAVPVGSKRQEAIVNCALFSSNIDGYKPCVQDFFHGFPKTVDPTQFYLYVDSDVYATEDWSFVSSQLQTIGEVVDAVWPTYKGYSSPISAVSLLLTPPPEDDDWAGLTDSPDWPHTNGGTCFVSIALNSDNYDLKQVVAHELYHCVEMRNHPDLLGPTQLDWIWDGMAEYFDEQLYPSSADSSGALITKYYPKVPLYKAAYNASLFWTYLKNQGWSDATLNQITVDMPTHSDKNNGRSLLVHNPIVKGAFPYFATAFADHSITFSDGTPIPQENPLEPMSMGYVDLDKDGNFDMFPVAARPWAFNLFTASFAPGQTVIMGYATVDESSVLWYRPSGTGEWTAFWGSQSQPATLAIGCPSGAQNVDTSIEMIVTSTADQDLSEGYVWFLRDLGSTLGCN